MTRAALFWKACARFERAITAAQAGDRREFAVQSLAHTMCQAALVGERYGIVTDEHIEHAIVLANAERP